MKKITVLDLLQLDLKENEALNLKCIAGRASPSFPLDSSPS